MDYQITFAPDLALNPSDFVAAWNNTPQCRDVAEARLGASTSAQFDPDLIAGGVAVLSSLALGVASNALYDLIKQALVRQGVRKRTEITRLDQPDGSRLLVVTAVEE